MLRIGDFSRLAQVSIKTLRFYDETGLFKPAEVDRFTGYRYYTLDQLPRLNRILVLKDFGLSLDQIAEILNDDLKVDEIRKMLRIKKMELQEQMEDTQARLTRLEMRLNQIEMEGKMPEYEVVMKRIEPQQVLSIRQIVPTSADIPQLFHEVSEIVSSHNIKSNGPWIALYHHAGYRDRDLDIEVAVPVETAELGDITSHGGRQMSVRTIPLIETAVTAISQGNYDEIGDVYRALNTYIHENALNYLGPAREIYLRGAGDTDDPAEYLTEVQYPVGDYRDAATIDGIELSTNWKDHLQQHLPFSRRARTALEFAKIEAAALQRQEINPVHVLLGLLRDSDGFAGRVLGDLGLTIEQVRILTPRGSSQSSEPLVTDSARQVVSYADADSRKLGHDYIGTEHLLLSLVHQQDVSVISLLATSGINAEQVRAAVLQALNR